MPGCPGIGRIDGLRRRSRVECGQAEGEEQEVHSALRAEVVALRILAGRPTCSMPTGWPWRLEHGTCTKPRKREGSWTIQVRVRLQESRSWKASRSGKRTWSHSAACT